MHVSMVELKAALRRCFEATGYFVGNYEDAAEMILWLEKHGLKGLNELESILPYIDEDRDKPQITTVYEDKSTLVIDGHNRSSLNCISSALDLAYLKCSQNGILTVTINNCHNRMFVLKALTDCGRRGASVLAYWQNGTDKVTEHTAAITSDAKYPSYSERIVEGVDSESPMARQQALTAIFSTRVDFSSSLKNQAIKSGYKHISSEQIAINKDQSVENGIEIETELWERINCIGAGVLVESNDLSRLGAG